jgi:F-type H+-transporting ATPase subunit b
MEQVLSSLQALIIRALPTFFLVLILHFYLKVMFFRPLESLLQERKDATTGTKKAAEEALAKAEAKAAEYDQKIRDARGQIYKEQEAIRAQFRQEQAGHVSEARAKVEARIREFRVELDRDVAEAKAGLSVQAEALAEQISRSILAGRV